jgi:hypothetical protein
MPLSRPVTAIFLGLMAALAVAAPPAAARLTVQQTRAVVFAPVSKAYARLGGPGPYFPDRAAREGVGGRVLLDCVVEGISRLDDCKVNYEAPPRYGFGDAALQMARLGVIRASPVNPYPSPRGSREYFAVDFPKPGEKPCPAGSRQRHC